ncbi:MAG: nuclear transport factor 2 family protein, partial [Candidatus Limnocylindrales bacterium]
MTFDLEARVRRLEDRVLISDRVISYAVAVDQHDWALFADCFTDPVHADYSENGLPAADFARDDLVDIVRSAVIGYTATQHLSANHVTEFDPDDPDRATCHSSMYAQHHLADGDELLILRGWYANHLVRVANGWKIDRIVQTCQLARGQTYMTDGLDRGEDVHMDDGASPTSTEPDVPA